jgi:hypothetical protein
MTPAELRATDAIGLPRFTTQQAKAVIDLVRCKGLLNCDPPACEGRGIVIAGGGRYLSWAFVNCTRLRKMGCNLPIQVWYLGTKEMPPWAIEMFKKLDVETVNAHEVMLKHPMREMGGWPLKTYAVRHCPWRQVIFQDADCIAQILPEEVFNDKDVQREGSLFFHDVGKHNSVWAYVDCGLSLPDKEFESGQFCWDKVSGWMALRWAMWQMEHTDVFFQTGHGDKCSIQTSVLMSQCPHLMGGPSVWKGWGIEHSFKGRVAYTHLMGAKRHETAMPFGLQELFDEWNALTLGRL